MFAFGGKGTNGTPFSANDMTHVSSLDWNEFPAGVVQVIFSQQSDQNTTRNMKIPLPSAGHFSSINKIHLVTFLGIVKLKQSRRHAFFVDDFLWLNSLNVLHFKSLIP